MAIKANLFIDQGTDYSTFINLVDTNDNILSLAGYTSSAQLKKTYSSSNSVSFNTSLQVSNGVIQLSLTSSQTANIVAGRYVYDVVVKSSSNVVSRIVEGIVTVTPRVTV